MTNVAFSPFDPSAFLSGLDWYMDADSVEGNDGDPVIDWFDSSGAAKHYGQNTSTRQPTLKNALYNGHNAIRFGTNKCLVPDPNPRVYGTANTLVCVCTRSSTSDYIIKGSGAEGGPAFISKFNPGSGVKDFEYFFASSGHERGTFAASASGLHILTMCKTDDTGNYVGYFDGTQVINSAVNTNDDWNVRQAAIIGAFTAGSSAYDGDICLILHFNANHAGTGGLTNLHNALKTRFSIP
jgi:hypothetical protein